MAGGATFAKIGPSVVPRLDRALHRLTGGRVILSGGMVPSLMLTTTGAKTGQARKTPLATMPYDGTLYVVGSNFGREHHPAWSGNLIKTPRAHVSFKGEDFEVDAHLLSPEEKATLWPELLKTWPTYDRYVERSGRDLRVFRLERVRP